MRSAGARPVDARIKSGNDDIVVFMVNYSRFSTCSVIAGLDPAIHSASIMQTVMTMGIACQRTQMRLYHAT